MVKILFTFYKTLNLVVGIYFALPSSLCFLLKPDYYIYDVRIGVVLLKIKKPLWLDPVPVPRYEH